MTLELAATSLASGIQLEVLSEDSPYSDTDKPTSRRSWGFDSPKGVV